MMKKEKRECVVCGKKFTPKTANAKYCSDKCYKKQKAILDKNRKAKDKKIVKSLVKGEKTTSKVETKEVVKLPKKPAVKVKVVRIKKSAPKEILIHEGDNVRFVDFKPERILKFGMRLVTMALEVINGHKSEPSKCKCAKKTAKKATKKSSKK